MRISASGTENEPIRLKAGYIGHGKDVAIARSPGGPMFFRNPKTSYRRSLPKLSGSRLIDIEGGVSNIEVNGLRGFGFSSDGLIKFRSGGDISDIVVRNLGCVRMGRVLESMKGSRVTGLTVENCDAYEVVRGFARFRQLSNSVFRDLSLNAGGVDGGKSQICELISITAGKGILFENLTLRGTDNMLGVDTDDFGDWYVQGDGIVVERETSNIVIRNCHGSGFGDSAFDLKGRGITIEDSSTTDCKFGARIWSMGDNVIIRSHFRSPRPAGGNAGACLQNKGRVTLVDCHLQAGPGGAVFSVEGMEDDPERRIIVQGGAISLDRGGRLVIGNGAGRIELRDVAVNGELTNRAMDVTGR